MVVEFRISFLGHKKSNKKDLILRQQSKYNLFRWAFIMHIHYHLFSCLFQMMPWFRAASAQFLWEVPPL